ncbi:hypothetical protein JI435_112540 [Parastagonospora nodorum SN15]|uniref:Uncharacterized protein n=1 Tax=Phaeosphaeria nodorum (strain SN15 / ATCC MYA-4574 / FGSC 10173) TaxID=321614 RepID=A0A7U2I8T9_PHANO|nr:hypothetical protein JI435_112540 [Parastagonospora nodorum SN15]
MAGSRRAQDIDQWRPEEPSLRDTQRDGPRERLRDGIDDPRPSSPARAARDSSRRRTNDTDTRPSTKNPRGRSRERSPSRDRTRRRSREASRDERHRTSRRTPSREKAAHSHRQHHHHHHHHRDTTPPPKRQRTRSPSPKDSFKRSKRHRSRSLKGRVLLRNALTVSGRHVVLHHLQIPIYPFLHPVAARRRPIRITGQFHIGLASGLFHQKDGRDVTSPCGGHHPEGIAIDEALRRDDREKDRTCPTLLDQRKEVAAVPLAPQGLALQPSGVLHSQLDVALHFTRDEA